MGHTCAANPFPICRIPRIHRGTRTSQGHSHIIDEEKLRWDEDECPNGCDKVGRAPPCRRDIGDDAPRHIFEEEHWEKDEVESDEGEYKIDRKSTRLNSSHMSIS